MHALIPVPSAAAASAAAAAAADSVISVQGERPVAMGDIAIDDPVKVAFRKEWETSLKSIKDCRLQIRKHEKIVPVVGRLVKTSSSLPASSFLSTRARLFQLGVYPGVEYRVVDIFTSTSTSDDMDTDTDTESISSVQEAVEKKSKAVVLRLRPAYPLIPELERQWPIDISLSDIPVVYTRGMYNTVTVVASAFTALSLFVSAFLVSQAVTLSIVNSRSMEPTIFARDVVLVEKVSPALKKAFGQSPANVGDIVFFTQPLAFSNEIALRKDAAPVGKNVLLVKRVFSITGGNDIDVRGDNPQHSFDSRDWGNLPSDNVIGIALFRLYPFSRFGLF